VKAIIGLGNPGSKYRNTRHNVGFMLTDLLAERYRLRFKAGKGEFVIAVSEDLDTALVKPLTYMNHSGLAVRDLLRRYPVTLPELLIVQDDLDLVLGRFKFKAGGSAGTHNGIRSVIYHLGDDNFARLKIGIDVEGRRDNAEPVDYVLNSFAASERKTLDEVLSAAADAADSYIREGLEQAMNTHHQRQ
jgi:peptidyl-tRNA hydrolase, PTH1 family